MDEAHQTSVALLTGGGDKPYVLGLATSLVSKGIVVDLIGSDEVDCPELRHDARVNFLNLRGDQSPDASMISKVFRVLRYYVKLIRYAASAKPKIFHILWNNKIELFDRTLLMVYYKLLRKKIVLTVHNVNAGKRDFNDTYLNRLTLRIQYRLADHVFVHTKKMKSEITERFSIKASSVTVIPFGINNAVPNTILAPRDAKRRLGLREGEKAILFFGNIVPYKGLQYLITAFHQLLARDNICRLIIAGRPKDEEKYWTTIRQTINEDVQNGRVILKAAYIPDDQVELYFKAADVLVLPYRHIYESGVLFLSYSFGLPVLASDVGSLKDEIIEGETGFVFRSEDPADLANAAERYFASDLYENLDGRRQAILRYAAERHSWDTVSCISINVYGGLLQTDFPTVSSESNTHHAPLENDSSQELHFQSRVSR